MDKLSISWSRKMKTKCYIIHTAGKVILTSNEKRNIIVSTFNYCYWWKAKWLHCESYKSWLILTYGQECPWLPFLGITVEFIMKQGLPLDCWLGRCLHWATWDERQARLLPRRDSLHSFTDVIHGRPRHRPGCCTLSRLHSFNLEKDAEAAEAGRNPVMKDIRLWPLIGNPSWNEN